MTETAELQAFAPGCDLWIVAAPGESILARRVDWYLNFQIMRAELHVPREASPEMRSILDAAELESPAVAGRSNQLMIASANLLPNRTTVVVPVTPDWGSACLALCKKLGSPKARVFLPEAVTRDEFTSSWPKGDSDSLELIDSRG